MNGLDLFSGIGGLTIALEDWVRPVAYCERDPYAQAVLLSRQQSGELPLAPIWGDVTSLSASMLPEIDIISGGFPCQDISAAGIGTGLGGERSSLFFEIVRLAKESKAKFIFLENVPAIRTRGLLEVIRALADIGYDCRWTCVSAAEVGAVHIRKRWFLLAHANGERLREEQREKLTPSKRPMEPNSEGSTRSSSRPSRGALKPRVDRTGDGLSFCVDRNSCLGNSVVPIQAKEAFKKLIGENI